jgi:hypothetical protein
MAVSTPYTRQSTFADGDLITDSLFNNEFNALINAFQYQPTGGTTGHQHDGSAQSGGNIYRIGDQDFKNKIEVGTDDNGVQDASNSITFYNEVGGVAVPQLVFADGTVLPATTNDVDLGSTTRKFKDLHLTQLKPEFITIGDGSASTNKLTFGADSDVNMFFNNTDNNFTITNTSFGFVFEGDAITANNPDTTNAFFSASDIGWAFYKDNNPSLYSVNANGIFAAEDITVDSNKKLTIGNNAFTKEIEIYNNSNVSYFTSKNDAMEIESPSSVKTIVNGTTRIEADTTGVDLTGDILVTGNTSHAGNLSIVGNLSVATGTTNFSSKMVGTAGLNLTSGGELQFDFSTGEAYTAYSQIINNPSTNNLEVKAGGELSLLSKDSTSSVKVYNDSTELADFTADYVKYSKPVALQTNKLLFGTFNEATTTATFEIWAGGTHANLINTSTGSVAITSSGGFRYSNGSTNMLDFMSDANGKIRSDVLTVNKLVVGADNTNIPTITSRNIDGVDRDGRFAVHGPDSGAVEGQFSIHNSENDRDMFIGSGYQDTDIRFFTRDNSFGSNLETSLHIESNGNINMYKWGTNKATKLSWDDNLQVTSDSEDLLKLTQRIIGSEARIKFESTSTPAYIKSDAGSIDLAPYESSNITFTGSSGVGLTFKATNNYLGLGTTNPDFKFHVNGGSSKLNNVVIGDSNAARAVIHGTPSAGMTLDVDSNAWITFTEGQEEVMRVGSNSKRVGIGVETPLERLDVSGNIKVSGTLRVDDEYSLPTTDGTNTQVLTTDGSGNLYWGTGVATGSNTSQWTTSASDIFYDTGGVTIGSTATPAQKLDVHGQTTTTGLDLKAIAETKSVTASDVFVYDTSKDSDGGAWRHRTQGTSWYNEDLNTSIRGATKKFPAVAVIVLTGSKTGANSENKVTIYDADDPSMPMWMQIAQDAQTADMLGRRGLSSIAMKDGLLCVTANDTDNTGGFTPFIRINFISDVVKHTNHVGTHTFPNVIADRASAAYIMTSTTDPTYWKSAEGAIVDPTQNDVAVTVLPNAPIDPDTGLPVPTIAVATDGGVSVIKDDGSVVDITGQVHGIRRVAWMGDKLITNGVYGDALAVYAVPSADQTHSVNEGYYVWQDAPSVFPGSTFDQIVTKEDNTIVSACARGLQHIHHKDADNHDSLSNQITSSYNTGWMNGDIKLATLMDTTAETINATELITNGDFSSFGSNIVSNGDFSNGTTGWSTNQTTEALQVVNGKLRVTEDGVADPNVARAWQEITTEVGKSYKVTADIDPANTTTCALNISNSVSTSQSINVQTSSTATTAEFYFTAVSTSTYVLLTVNSANTVGSYADFDNVTVQEVTGWEGSSNLNSSLSVNNGRLRIESIDPGYQQGYQEITNLEVGKTYRVKGDVYYVSGSVGWLAAGYSGAYEQYGIVSVNSTTTTNSLDATFVAASSTFRVKGQVHNATGGLAVEIDNISVEEVVADRSINNNGINIVGSVTKGAVATDAELVGYGTTGSSNYLTQPYNSDYNFGYGDFCIMGWAKHVGGDQTLFYRGTGNGFQETGGLYLWINNHKLKFRAGGNRQFEVDAPISPMNSGQWHHYVVCRRDGVVYAYQDGVLFYSQNISVSNIDSSTHITKISSGYYANNNLSNRLALLRISATAPTSEQIAKIYRDEKPLFQEGAKCTLYGEYDDVSAIAYDDGTELLHAGTSAASGTRGRSVFSGLRRVDHTHNTNISVALSASNGLVVEE